MNLDEIAQLMGVTRKEVEEILNSEDVIELNLTDNKKRMKKVKEKEKIEVIM